LSPGIEVFTSAGTWAVVSGSSTLPAHATVHNLVVDGSHTYFVGLTGCWVHNSCFPEFNPTQAPGRFDPARLAAYERDMRAGAWDWDRGMATGQPIIVDAAGSIMSGHHRVLAAFMADIPIPPAAIMRFPGTSPRAARTWQEIFNVLYP
jgi:hypothetical protein